MKKFILFTTIALSIVPIVGCGKDKKEVTFIAPGGWICGTPQQAAGNARLQGVLSQIGRGFRGCEQVGDEVPVNILKSGEFMGYQLLQVGNNGGTAWVAASDVKTEMR